MADENMRSHLDDVEQERRLHYDGILGSDTAQLLLLHLTGGQSASRKQQNANDPAARATKTQIPAAPETLKFAKYLCWNATNTADRFQKMSFDYQKTSSNAIDSFATQIQGMVKKVQGFIKMMMQYSTPDGINSLENTLLAYADKAVADMLIATKRSMAKKLTSKDVTLTQLSADLDHSKRISTALEGPLGNGLAP